MSQPKHGQNLFPQQLWLPVDGSGFLIKLTKLTLVFLVILIVNHSNTWARPLDNGGDSHNAKMTKAMVSYYNFLILMKN